VDVDEDVDTGVNVDLVGWFVDVDGVEYADVDVYVYVNMYVDVCVGCGC